MAEAAQGGTDSGVSGQAKQADGEVTERGQDAGQGTGPDSGGVFTVGDVADPCAMRRCCSSGGGRPSLLSLSQQGGEAEGSRFREVPEWVGAALTKPGRASTARWCGSGERDEEEYERNP